MINISEIIFRGLNREIHLPHLSPRFLSSDHEEMETQGIPFLHLPPPRRENLDPFNGNEWRFTGGMDNRFERKTL